MRYLKIESLPPSKEWVDRDEVLLHACFQVLVDCVEKENVNTHCDYEYHKKFVDEVNFLYQWWQKRKTKEDDSFGDESVEDDEMLIRLIKIRTGLWT